MEKKTILEMTKDDFDQVPRTENFNKPLDIFWSVVIIPTGIEHESRWYEMDFITVDKDLYPITRISLKSEAMCIDGLGGYGKSVIPDVMPMQRPIQGWIIDCLPCGYLRLFSNGKLETGGIQTNCFEIYHIPLKPEDYVTYEPGTS